MQRSFESGPTPGRRGGALALVAAVAIVTGGCTKEAENRVQSIYDLRRDPSPANLEQIRAALTDPNPQVRVTAMFTLVTAEVPDGKDIALAGLVDPDGFVRMTAAMLLGEFPDPSLSGPLAARVEHDPDAHVRHRAAEALGRTGGEEAARGLAIGLSDPIKSVRLASVVAVAQLGPAPYVDRLRKLATDDPEWEVRVQAVRALGTAGDPAALPEIDNALRDPSEFVRAAAAFARKRVVERPAGSAPTESPGS